LATSLETQNAVRSFLKKRPFLFFKPVEAKKSLSGYVGIKKQKKSLYGSLIA